MIQQLGPVRLDVGAFTAFDWLLVLIVLFSTVTAFMKGIIRVLFSLAGLVLGIVLAGWNYLALAERLHRWIVSFQIAEITAFLLILAGVTIAASLLAGVLRKAVSAVGLGFFDRLLGAVFGLVRGVLLGVAVLMAALAFLPGAGAVENSQLAPYFLAGSHAVSFVVPKNLQLQIGTGARHLLESTPDSGKRPARSGTGPDSKDQ